MVQAHTPDISGTSEQVYEHAKRKARYGRFAWVIWKDRAGLFHAARASAGSIKAAMLAVGTAGRWTFIGRRSQTFQTVQWGQSCIMFRNSRRFGASILS